MPVVYSETAWLCVVRESLLLFAHQGRITPSFTYEGLKTLGPNISQVTTDACMEEGCNCKQKEVCSTLGFRFWSNVLYFRAGPIDQNLRFFTPRSLRGLEELTETYSWQFPRACILDEQSTWDETLHNVAE